MAGDRRSEGRAERHVRLPQPLDCPQAPPGVAPEAQMAEQLTRNEQDAGSSPAWGSFCSFPVRLMAGRLILDQLVEVRVLDRELP